MMVMELAALAPSPELFFVPAWGSNVLTRSVPRSLKRRCYGGTAKVLQRETKGRSLPTFGDTVGVLCGVVVVVVAEGRIFPTIEYRNKPHT